MGWIKDLLGGGTTTTTVAPGSAPISYSAARPMDFRLGGKAKIKTRPNDYWTNIEGNADFNKSARTVTNSLGKQRTRIGGMIKGLRGNQNAFIQARVRPLQQELASTIADQKRGFAQRGVFGSLSQNEVNNTRFLGQREIGDARAKATDEALGALFDAEAAMRGVNQDEMGVAESRVKDEMLRLGISMDALQIVLGDRKQTTQVAGGTTASTPPIDVFGTIGKVIGIGSEYKKL